MKPDVVALILNIIAGILLVVSNLFQIARLYKIKNSVGLSLTFVVMAIIYTFLYAIYGFIEESLPILIVNVVAMLEMITVLYMKIYYGKKQKYLLCENNELSII